MAGTTDINGKLTCNFKLRGSAIEGDVNGANITATYSFFVDYEIDGVKKSITLKGNEQQTFVGTLTEDGILKDTLGNVGIHLYVNSINDVGGSLIKHTIDEDDIEITYMGDFIITSEITDSTSNLIMRDEAGYTNITINGVRKSYEINVTYDWDVQDVSEWVDEDDETWYGELAGSISLRGEGYKNRTFGAALSKTTTTIDGVEVDGDLSNVTVAIGNALEISNTTEISINYTGENDAYEYSLTGSFDLGESVNNQILSPRGVIARRSAKGAAIDADFVWQEGTSDYTLTEMISTTGNCKRTGETKTLPVVSSGVPTVNGVQMSPFMVPQTIDVTVNGDTVSSGEITFMYFGSDYMYDYGLSGTFEIQGTVADHDYYGEVTVTTTENKKPVSIISDFDWSSYEDATGYYELAGYFDLAGSSVIGGSGVANISVGSTPTFNDVQLNAVTEPTSVNFSISNDKELSSDEFVFEYSGEDYDYAYGLTGRFNLNETLGFDEHSSYDETVKCEVNTNPVEIIPYRIPLPKNIAACYNFPAQVEHESGYYTVAGKVCISGTGTIDSICSPTQTTVSQISVDGYILNNVAYEKQGLIKIDGSNNVSLIDSDGNDMKYTGSWSGADSSGGIYTLTCEADFTEDSTTRSHALVGNITITKTYSGYHKGWSEEMNIDSLYTTETATLSDTTEKKVVVSLVDDVLTYDDETTFNLATEGHGSTTTIVTQPAYVKSTALRNDGLFAYTALANVSTDFSELINGMKMFNNCSELVEFTAKEHMNKLTIVTDMFNYCSKLAGFYSDMAALVDGKNMFKTCSSLQSVTSNMNSLENGTQMFKDLTTFNTFEGNLESLTNGTQMFSGCTVLDTIDTKQSLANLQIADYMFYNTAISSFSRDVHGDLNSVTSASAMLGYCGNLTDVSVHMPNVISATNMLNGCTKLKNYEGSLESLVDAKGLFKSAQSTLETVNSDLSSMVDGTQMFVDFANLKSFTGDLSELTTGDNMFQRCTSLTTFDADVPVLESGRFMFPRTKLAGWNLDNNENRTLSNLTDGYTMFFNCSEFAEFNGDLSNLVIGYCMFDSCPKLTSFENNLAKLEDGYQMFARNGLLTFSTPTLKSLTNAEGMFRAVEGGAPHPLQSFTVEDGDMNAVTTGKHMFQACASLQSFTGNLASMTEGTAMFQGCTSLQSFTCGDLGSLQNGNLMFHACSSLTTFNANLPELTNSDRMFEGCTALATVSTEMPKMTTAKQLFKNCSNLTNVKADMPIVTNATEMLSGCSALQTWEGSLESLVEAKGLFKSAQGTLTSVKSDLSSMVDGSNMFEEFTKLDTFVGDLSKLEVANSMFAYTILPSFNSDLSALTDGSWMFNAVPLTSFDKDLSSLTNGYNMFWSCESLTSFDSELPELTNGDGMFHYTGLTSFYKDLPSLTNGDGMFSMCTSFQSFYGELPNLNRSHCMFSNTPITEFAVDMPSLDYGALMFNECAALESFYSKLPSLTNANDMFNKCVSLTTVGADMPSVTSATEMLSGCSALQTWEGSLQSLVDAKNLFKSAQSSLMTVTTDLSSMVDGTQMFNKFTKLGYYSGALSKMEIATEMFAYTTIASFIDIDLSSLKVAPRMFSKNTVLTTFACDLPAMTNSIEDNEAAGITNWKPADAAYPKGGVFNECAALESFSGDLSKLVSGYKMFYNCKSLTSFNVSEEGLKSLECGACMFMNCGDTPTGDNRFTTFNSNLSALKDAYGMFWGIDTLTSFYAGEEGLNSLERGIYMFSNCRLDGTSVEHILNTIPTYTGTPILPASQLPANEEEGKGYLQLGLQQAAAETFVNLYSTVTGVTPVLGTDGVYSVDGSGWMDFRGWKIGARING